MFFVENETSPILMREWRLQAPTSTEILPFADCHRTAVCVSDRRDKFTGFEHWKR
jgi:hypothetical protein